MTTSHAKMTARCLTSLVPLLLLLLLLALLPFGGLRAAEPDAARMVIDARAISHAGGSKYFSCRLAVIQVIAAPGTFKVPREIEVAIRFDQPALPDHACRVVLEPYHPDSTALWKVVSWSDIPK